MSDIIRRLIASLQTVASSNERNAGGATDYRIYARTDNGHESILTPHNHTLR